MVFLKALTDKKLAAGACLAFKEFASSPSLMPFVVQNLPKLIEALNDKQKDALLNRIPVNSLGTPEDIAAAALYLASNEASYITGQTLHINGGMAML